MTTCLKNHNASFWTLCGTLVDTLDSQGRDSEVVTGETYGSHYCEDCRRAHAALSELETEASTKSAVPSFAEQVLAAARGLAGDTRSKVFLCRVWEAMGRPELTDFQARLLEANRTRELSLTRCDLVAAFDMKLVAASELRSYNASFHFLVVR